MKRRQLRLAILLVTLLGLVLLLGGCTSEPVYTTVMGEVTDSSGRAARDAAVLIGGTAAVTDSSGRFYLEQVRADSTQVTVLVKGKLPESTPVVLGTGPQTLALQVSGDYRSSRSGSVVDFVVLLPTLAGTDLEQHSGFSFLTGAEIAQDASRLLGISDLRRAVEYFGLRELALVSDVLRTRNLVWISEGLSDQLQVFNRETGQLTNLPFGTTSRSSGGGSRRVKGISQALKRFMQEGPAAFGGAATQVVAHRESRMYHREDANHLPARRLQVYFSSREAAEREGYRPDPACFGAAAQAAAAQLDSDEAKLAREVTAYIESQYRITYSGEEMQRIKRVAEPIIAVSERASLSFTFGILETSEYNALALPGGFIFITRPLLELLETDSELGAVIAHEMAHITHMHGVANYRRQLATAIAAVFLAVATGDAEGSFDLVGFIDGIVTEGYSKSQEYDADRTGFRYLNNAGYEPEGMVTMLRKLLALERSFSGGRRVYSRTHPATESRISRIEATMGTVKYYRILGAYL